MDDNVGLLPCDTEPVEVTAEEEAITNFLAAAGTNARKWAQEFSRVATNLGYSQMDEGWLIGWFAAAIENAKDTQRHSTELSSSHDGPENTTRMLRFLAPLSIKEIILVTCTALNMCMMMVPAVKDNKQAIEELYGVINLILEDGLQTALERV